MAEQTPIIEIKHVSFGYAQPPGTGLVLEDIDLQVLPRDFLGIIGPNGGGKTTLLKIILGLLKPQRGTVKVFGRSALQSCRSIGYVPQHTRLDATVPASVLDVVLMGRLGRASWGARFGSSHVATARQALIEAEAEELTDRSMRNLSGGQRQRVLIARALASESKLLLLDEPTAGVDPGAERSLTNLLHRLNQNIAIVVVSHDVAFVSTHLKRVACLNRQLTCHGADEITDEMMALTYHSHVRTVHHHEQQCPLADAGCDHNHNGST